MAYADSSNAARPCLTAKDAEATRIEERNYVWSEEVDASGRRRYIVAPIGTMFRVLLRQDGRSQRLGGLRLHCALITPLPRPPTHTLALSSTRRPVVGGQVVGRGAGHFYEVSRERGFPRSGSPPG